jgi:hypothetical protein
LFATAARGVGGAFLNEAINQLPDAYMERKQAETGRKKR